MKFAILLVSSVLIATSAVSIAEPVELQRFTLTESFGVSHPDQIIDFNLERQINPAEAHLIGPDGAPVVWQLIDGGRKIAVRTDLPADSQKTWRLMSGRSAQQPELDGLVHIAENDDLYEITNGLTGVRIPQPAEDLGTTPAPVQGLLYRDGTWTASGTNRMNRPARSMDVRFIERGPIITVAEIEYNFDEGEYYRSTITVQAGQPSVTFEEEANVNVSYSLELYDGLAPTHARYRGHHSRSTADGYEAGGGVYRAWHERPSMDAFVDLTYDRDRSYREIAVWDPWRFNTGWYWQMYDDNAPDDANIMGVFAGRASRALGASWSGVGAFSGPAGVQDLATAASGDGTIHAVYQSGNDLWYVRFDRRLTASEPLKIAEGLRSPDVTVAENGAVFVLAYDPTRSRFNSIEIKPDGTSVRTPVVLEGLDGVSISDPFPYQTTRGDEHFLFFCGTVDGEPRGLLYSRAFDEDSFVHCSTLDSISSGRQIYRACFETLFDGNIRLIATDRGGYAFEALITPNSSTFSGVQPFAGRPQNFGSALDPVSGTAVICDYPDGNLREYGLLADAQATPLRLPADHHGQGANRRTLATAPDGTAVLLFGGSSGNEFRHSVYRKRGGTWTRWLDAGELDLASARVHYHEATRQFVFLGRKDGKLCVLTSSFDAEKPAVLRDLPQTESRTAGIRVACEPRERFERSRFQWGFFAGVKGSDLLPPGEVQPIARQMNLHGGINLNKVHRYQLDFPDPPEGYGATYMNREVLDRMVGKLRADTAGPHGRGYHNYLYNAEPYSRPLVDFWRDTTDKGVTDVAERIGSEARTILDSFVNRDGIYTMGVHYWHGGLAMSRLIVWIDQLLASELATPEQKAAAKAAAALFGYILWDNDYVPMFDGHGLNLGTANMPVQQANYQQMYALYLASHPFMADRVGGVAEAATGMLQRTVNEHGAHMGSSHYLGASMGPLLNTMVQLKQAGVSNPFATEERLRRFAEFYMQFATPPDPRYDNRRIRIPCGDSEPANPQYLAGVMGTAYAGVDDELSARLMGSWAQSGKPHTGFHVTTLLMTDDDLPQAAPNLGSAVFPGYMAVLRSGWGTPHEAAAWLIGGEWYHDHRVYEHAIVSMYAHSAPLALNFGPMYSPYAPSALIRNMLVPADSDWKAVPAPHEGGPRWQRDVLGDFQPAPDGGTATATAYGFDTEWHRKLTLAHTTPEQPVFMLNDTFGGEPLVFSLAMACTGDVQTPEGVRNAGQGFTVPAGISTLGFTGQPLEKHHSGGIDWNLYVIADAPYEGFLTEWSHSRNRGQRQVILRLKGEHNFRVVIVPWPKGHGPQNIEVSEDGGRITIGVNGRSIQFDREGRRLR